MATVTPISPPRVPHRHRERLVEQRRWDVPARGELRRRANDGPGRCRRLPGCRARRYRRGQQYDYRRRAGVAQLPRQQQRRKLRHAPAQRRCPVSAGSSQALADFNGDGILDQVFIAGQLSTVGKFGPRDGETFVMLDAGPRRRHLRRRAGPQHRPAGYLARRDRRQRRWPPRHRRRHPGPESPVSRAPGHGRAQHRRLERRDRRRGRPPDLRPAAGHCRRAVLRDRLGG